MTPQSHYRGKIVPASTGSAWLRWVPVLTVLGGLAGALAAFLFHKKDLALGLAWGSVLTSSNFYCLKILTEKLVSWEPQGNRKRFWFWTAVRWVLLALACWILLSVSPTCLAGAGLSYFWFLLVLGFTGWTFSKPKDSTTERSKFF